MKHHEAPRPFDQRKRIAVLWGIALATGFAIIFGQPAVPDENVLHELLETTGLACIAAAVFGRLWSILYIGGRKNRVLVVDGPYSVTRNPLYFFSLTGLVGIGLIFGSLLLTLALLTAGGLLFGYTALREADYLRSRFGPAYEGYEARTPFFLPDPRLYRSAEEVTFSAAALGRSFRDCLPLLAIYPVNAFMEELSATGYLSPLFYLP